MSRVKQVLVAKPLRQKSIVLLFLGAYGSFMSLWPAMMMTGTWRPTSTIWRLKIQATPSRHANVRAHSTRAGIEGMHVVDEFLHGPN